MASLPPAYTWPAESEGPLGCWVAGGEADPVPFLGFSWAPGCMWPLLPYTSVMRCVSLLCLKWDLGFAKVRGKSKTTECPGSISEVCAEGESDHVCEDTSKQEGDVGAVDWVSGMIWVQWRNRTVGPDDSGLGAHEQRTGCQQVVWEPWVPLKVAYVKHHPWFKRSSRPVRLSLWCPPTGGHPDLLSDLDLYTAHLIFESALSSSLPAVVVRGFLSNDSLFIVPLHSVFVPLGGVLAPDSLSEAVYWVVLHCSLSACWVTSDRS